MSRSHVLTPSWTSAATATSNGAATAATDADNLFKTDHTKKFKSNANTNVRITLSAPEARPANAIYLGYTNVTSAGQVTITMNASTGTLYTAPSFTHGPVTGVFAGDLSPFTAYDILIPLPSTQTYRYIGIEIDDPTNPNTIEAGVAIAGVDFEPKIGAEQGWGIGAVDPSDQKRTLSGIGYVRAKRKFKAWEGTFPKQDNTDGMRWLGINYVYGSSIPVLAWWEPWDTGFQQYFTIYGHLQWPRKPVRYVHSEPRWDVEVSIEEVSITRIPSQ